MHFAVKIIMLSLLFLATPFSPSRAADVVATAPTYPVALNLPDYADRPLRPYLDGTGFRRTFTTLRQLAGQPGAFELGYQFEKPGHINILDPSLLQGRPRRLMVRLMQRTSQPGATVAVILLSPKGKTHVLELGNLDWTGERSFDLAPDILERGVIFRGYRIHAAAAGRGHLTFAGVAYQADCEEWELLNVRVPDIGYVWGDTLGYSLARVSGGSSAVRLDCELRSADESRVLQSWTQEVPAEAGVHQRTRVLQNIAPGRYKLCVKASLSTGVHTYQIPIFKFFARPTGPLLDRIGTQSHASHRLYGGTWPIRLMANFGFRNHRDEMLWETYEQVRGIYQLDDAMGDVLTGIRGHKMRELTILGYAQPLYTPDRRPPTSSEALDAWRDYCGRAVKDLKPFSDEFEVWNEPNLDMFWRPIPKAADYALLLQATYKAVKNANPKATVVAMSTSSVDRVYIHDVLNSLGGKRCFDAISIHPYSFTKSPEDGRLIQNINDLANDLDQRGLGDIPLWVTELGWASSTSRGDPDEVHAAAYGVRSFMSLLAIPRVQRIYWYELYDGLNRAEREENFGLVRSDGTPKPVAFAMATFLHQLDDALSVRRLDMKNANLHVYRIEKRRGGPAYAIWTADAKRPVSVTVKGRNIRVIDTLGVETPVTPNENRTTLVATGMPLYLLNVSDMMLASDMGDPSPAVAIELLPATPRPSASARVKIQNLADTTLAADCRVECDGRRMLTREVKLAPSGAVELMVPVESDSPTSQKKITCTVTPKTGTACSVNRYLNFWQAAPTGSSVEKGAPEFSTNDYPVVEVPGAKGPPFRLSVATDTKNYLFTLRVNDPVHFQPFDASQIWRADCVQLALATEKSVRDNRYMELNLAMGQDGQPMFVCSTDPGLRIQAAVRRVGKQTEYVLSVPTSAVTQALGDPQGLLRIAAVVNNSNGGERSFTSLFGGIADRKAPDEYGYLLLDRQQKPAK